MSVQGRNCDFFGVSIVWYYPTSPMQYGLSLFRLDGATPGNPHAVQYQYRWSLIPPCLSWLYQYRCGSFDHLWFMHLYSSKILNELRLIAWRSVPVLVKLCNCDVSGLLHQFAWGRFCFGAFHTAAQMGHQHVPLPAGSTQLFLDSSWRKFKGRIPKLMKITTCIQ